MPGSTGDFVALIETSYDVGQSEPSWLESIARASVGCLDHGGGAFTCAYDATRRDWVEIGASSGHAFPMQLGAALFQIPDLSREAQRKLVHLYRNVSSGSFRDIASALGNPGTYDSILEQFGFKDLFFVNAIDPHRVGCLLCIPTKKPIPSGSAAKSWRQAATHIAAGHRVRRRLGTLSKTVDDGATVAEAVLEVSGKSQHAQGPAASTRARSALADAVVRIEKARGKLRRTDPDAALDLWRGLVDGRWSLIQHFDTDGRRYFLAHRNDPRVQPLRDLTDRERQVLAYATRGDSNKMIAYALGISASTVGALLSRARIKLGKLTRLQAIQAFGALLEPEREGDTRK